MNAWWWVLIGLVAWFGVSLAAGLILGPVLRRASRAREALDADPGETPAGREKPPQNGHSPRDALRLAQLWMLDPHRRPPPEMPAVLASRAGNPGLSEVSVWAALTHQGR